MNQYNSHNICCVFVHVCAMCAAENDGMMPWIWEEIKFNFILREMINVRFNYLWAHLYFFAECILPSEQNLPNKAA